MVLPDRYNDANGIPSMKNLHYYQGVLIAEVALTLVFYLIFKIIHYLKWGHDEEHSADDKKVEDKKQGNEEEQTDSKKWDQKAWNVYFPIIFANHIAAISLIIIYVPYVFSAVIGFLHFLCFITLIILNICIKDTEPGNGSRTRGTRVVWAIMCIFNIMLMVGGLAGVGTVLT